LTAAVPSATRDCRRGWTARWRAAAAALALTLTGCELKDAGDNLVNGKELFVEKCGACHALDRAGTAGTIGPDLDSAFRRARVDGLGSGTIAGVVQGQILHPGRDSRMPAGLVKGEDAEDVAAYVARAAAVPGRDTGRLADVGVEAGGPPGRRIFVQAGCGSCHRLADAGTSASTGPDLDRALRGASGAAIRRSIVAPDAAIAEGFAAGVMPGDYAQRLSGRELDALVEYLARTAE
jgi:mono/diheme cytochrome c family protein